MGILLSRWRKKPSTIEQLESLDKDIKSLEQKKRTSLDFQKKVIGSLVLYSVLGYIIAVVSFYFLYLPEAWTDRILYSAPLFAFPLIILFIKRILHWYFVQQISKNDQALEDTKAKRKTILEEVMEKETYKKAREILEKYDPDSLKSMQDQPANQPTQQNTQGDLRQRKNVSPSVSPSKTPHPVMNGQGTPAQTPLLDPSMGRGRGAPVMPTPVGRGTPGMPRPPGPPMPRSILPRERSLIDRLVEGLVGDGPQNRYALICRECCSHNGMALKEEFEYISFRCCYCYRMNPARKVKANPPRLDLTPALKRRSPPKRGPNGYAAMHQMHNGFRLAPWNGFRPPQIMHNSYYYRHVSELPNAVEGRPESQQTQEQQPTLPTPKHISHLTHQQQQQQAVEDIQALHEGAIAEESSGDDDFVELDDPKDPEDKKAD